MNTNILITTPIYYVNSSPHIGHAYTNIIAGALKRFYTLNHHKTYLLTGTDEHGQKIEESAKKSNLSIQEFIDLYSQEFKKLAIELNIQYDDFIRTSEEKHKIIVSLIWQILQQKDYIYLGQYSGWYSMRDEAFYSEDELINGKAPTGAEVVWHEEESYFFKLAKFQDKLLQFYQDHPEFIQPSSRTNEIINFVKNGLQDLCISRKNFTHGIKVPGNNTHVIYVWIDALANYISALGFGQENSEKFKQFWPQSSESKISQVIHVIGKDIIRFHAIYWPALLFALDLQPPSNLLVHGWWLNQGEKISKSLGNVIDPFQLMQQFDQEYINYFFLSETNLASDGNYDQQKFVQKINADLVNNIGNLISRVTNMTQNYLQGIIELNQSNELYHLQEKPKQQKFWHEFNELIKEFKLNTASQEITKFSSELNLLIDQYQPWKIIKNHPANLDQIKNLLYTCLQGIKLILIALYIYMPNKSIKILCLLLNYQSLKTQELKLLAQQDLNYQNICKINEFNRLS